MQVKDKIKAEIILRQNYDVLVIGGGNAALCAAMTARESGAEVLLLESAPFDFRGGNSRHTRNLRYLHKEANDFLTGPYLEEEFMEDLVRVTKGHTNEKLARLTIRESAGLGDWMESHGCMFQPPLTGTLHLARTNAHFLGGGKALMNAYYKKAEKLGVKIIYEAPVQDLEINNGDFHSALVEYEQKLCRVKADSVVIASGGFQANISWLEEYWGSVAKNFIVRGTPFNRGLITKVLMDKGAGFEGKPKQCHCVAVDARAPKFDGGIVTRLDCVSFGVVVNKSCQRFYDEGEDFWPKRYAIWGRLVAGQPDQIGYCIIDSKSLDEFMPSVFPPVTADSLAELATKLELDPEKFEKTIHGFNQSIVPGKFDSSMLDDCKTQGIDPKKSHWARPIDSPPFYGYPLRPGITFTYLGVAVNKKAQVIMKTGRPSSNMFAAGEIMSGNVLGQGYMAGFGLTIGTVFGRIAGKEAASHAIKS